MNFFMFEKTPEHKIIDSQIFETNEGNMHIMSQQFFTQFEFDDFPNDFIYEFKINYSDRFND